MELKEIYYSTHYICIGNTKFIFLLFSKIDMSLWFYPFETMSLSFTDPKVCQEQKEKNNFFFKVRLVLGESAVVKLRNKFLAFPQHSSIFRVNRFYLISFRIQSLWNYFQYLLALYAFSGQLYQIYSSGSAVLFITFQQAMKWLMSCTCMCQKSLVQWFS